MALSNQVIDAMIRPEMMMQTMENGQVVQNPMSNLVA